METITNLASTAATTASKLIYGDQAKTDDTKTVETTNNETAGKEPISGAQGKGTVSEPFDQGNAATPLATSDEKKTFLDYSNNYSSNETAGKEPILGEHSKTSNATDTSGSDDFLKLNPKLDGPEPKTHSSGDPKIYTNRDDATYTGMPIVPLNPDVASSGVGTTSSHTIGGTGSTDKTGVTDKVWKPTEIDDISRTGAPGAGPSAPDSVTPAVPDTTTAPSSAGIKTTAPDSVTAPSDTYGSSTTNTGTQKATDTTIEGRDTPAWATANVAAASTPSNTTKPTVADESKSLVGEKSSRKSESGKSPELAHTASNDEKESKMSALKDKLKNKLHLGSKDK